MSDTYTPKRAKCWSDGEPLDASDFPVTEYTAVHICAPESDYEPKRAMR